MNSIFLLLKTIDLIVFSLASSVEIERQTGNGILNVPPIVAVPYGLPIFGQKLFAIAQTQRQYWRQLYFLSTFSCTSKKYQAVSTHFTDLLIFYGTLSSDCWLKVYVETAFSSSTSFMGVSKANILANWAHCLLIILATVSVLCKWRHQHL